MTTETQSTPHPITQWLERSSTQTFSAFAILTAFGIYFSMYAFRKSFAAGEFVGEVALPLLPALKLKSLYVLSQVFGYCLSKFAGIKIISELSASKRALMILGVIGLAEVSLLLFAITPAPWSAVWLFLNGAPLGMVWGLVFGFLEGRKLSELLGAGLSASYIVASGVVKSVGRQMIDYGISEYWMPFLTGLLFTLPLVLCVYLISKLPPPNAEDEALRTRREPMTASDRRTFVTRFMPGLSALTLLYFFLTAYRTVRDDFAVEIWKEIDPKFDPSILATSEMWVGFGVLAVLAFFVGIRDNRRALISIHWVMLIGSALVGVLTFAKQAELISPVTWMIGIGLGLYLAYVPYGCMLFDRMIASLGVVATAGFMIYVTDSFGYLGYIVILLYKDFAQENTNILDFFITFSYVTSAICVLSFGVSLIYFNRVSAPSKISEQI